MIQGLRRLNAAARKISRGLANRLLTGSESTSVAGRFSTTVYTRSPARRGPTGRPEAMHGDTRSANESFASVRNNDILNEAGQPVYQVDGKVLSLRGLMLVNDMSGNEVATVSRKLVALLATYEITLAGGGSAEVHQRFASPLHPKWTTR